MRKRWLTLTLLAVALLLSGCRVSGEVENQAYVLALGVDRMDDGLLLLTARVPQIGKSGESGEKQGSGGYLTFTGSGNGFPQALEALEQATPRQTNLSHIELIAVSEALASETDFAIYFLDIQGVDGLEAARELRARERGGASAVIVFVTGYRDYMAEAFDVHAFQYLV